MNSSMKHRARGRTPWVLALVGVCVWSAGCTSGEQYRKTLEDKDAQIRALREERAELKRERDEQLAQLDGMSVQLQEANARVVETPAEQPALQRNPGLDELGIGYSMRNGMAVITIPSSISFPSGKAELSDQGKTALRKVAAVLKESHASGLYSIEGHTDTDPIKKSGFENNPDLSLERARAVLAYLVEECRSPDEQCLVVGHGQYRPLESGSSTNAKAKNRRVEIVVHAAAP
jgi:chemotaxis protein MotB